MIILRISLSPKRVVIKPFTFFLFSFFFYTLLFLTPYLLLILSYSYTKERVLKGYYYFYKYFSITLTFSSFIIRLADTLVSI